MAKVIPMFPSHRALALAVALALSAGPLAAAEIPDAVIAAEQRGDWAEAAARLREALAAQPGDVELWRRLGQVEAQRGETVAAAEAYGRAAALLPNDPGAQAQHSRALATANRPDEALTAIERALALDPDNIDFLLARAQLANWAGRPEVAADSLDRALALGGERVDLFDDIARQHAWRGELDAAIEWMDRYLVSHPDDRAAQLDRARFLAWRGDYPAAIAALDGIEAAHGRDAESEMLRARVLAWAGRHHEALALNTPLLAAQPDDAGLNFNQALALRQTMIPALARPHVYKVQAARPDAPETRDLVRSTNVILASKAGVRIDVTEDSDDIRHLGYGAYGELVLSDRLRLLLDLGERRVKAPVLGPFAPDGGGNEVRERRGRVGLRYALDEDHALTVRVGSSDLDRAGNTGLFSLAFEGLPSDTFSYLVGVERDRVAASPKSLSRGIAREGAVAEARFTPNLRDTVDVALRYDDYSDDNDRTHLGVAWRRAMLRSERVMVDLGLAGEWLHFDRDPGNGYYAPDNYRRLSLIGGAYWPIGEDNGLSLQLGLGAQRDESFDSWKRAGDIAVEYTHGIHADWQLKLRAGYSERVQGTGAFEGASLGLTVERRF